MAQLDLKPTRRPPPTDNEQGAVTPAVQDIRPTRLSEKDAIDLWFARWLKTPRARLRERYNVDPRRIYEVWEEVTFIGSRQKAWAAFLAKHPDLEQHVDNGRHKRFARDVDMDGQPTLFPTLPVTRGRR